MKLGQPLALGLEALRLAQQTTQAVVEFDQPVALGNRGVALGNGRRRQRAQRINIVGKRISRSVHAASTAHHRRFASAKGAPDSLYRGLLHSFRRNHAPRVDAHPIQTLKQRRQLRRRQSHHAVLDARPAEFAALQPFGEQAQARAVPEDQFHSVGALGNRPITAALRAFG